MALTDDQLYKLIDNVNSYHRLVSESKGELLLNKYPNAAAAYSLRLLDGYYRGPLVRVRRDGDGAEVDVYADYNNELSLDSLVTNVDDIDDTTTDPDKNADATFLKGLQSLGEFVHDDAYDSVNPAVTATVCVWYDQSSTNGVANDNDAKQAVATSQPKIYDSSDGLVLESGKPAIEGDGTDGKHLTTSDIALASDLCAIAVCSFDTSNKDSMIFGGTFAATKGYLWRQGATQMNWKNNNENGFANFTVSLLPDNNLLFGNRAATDVSLSVNGNNSTVAESATQGLGFTINRLGGAYSDQYSMDGKYQEMVFYNSDQFSNRQGIEQDINNHYQIEGYTPPEPLIDLTKRLATEAGDPESEGTPAAAYSLRKLSSSYSGPLVRVRRSTDNTEVDVYPDDKGAFSVLSTIVDGGDEISNVSGGSTTKTKLYEFVYGQACDLTVVVWYDQAHAYKPDWYTTSTDQNNATQDATGSQPKVYDSSTGVVTENGKAAVQFNGTSSRMTSPMTVASDFTTSVVLQALTASQSNQWLLQDTSGTDMLLRHKDTNYDFYDGTTTHTIGTAGTNQHHIFITANASGSVVSFDGVDKSISAIANNGYTDLEIGADSASRWWHGKFQEIVIWGQYQSANRTGIEQNLNDYYNIY